jgi:putative membrane protein
VTTHDPRVYFAAERTLLAWIRTGLGVMALGFVVERFGLFIALLGLQSGVTPARSPVLSSAIGVALALAGAAVIAWSSRQHVVYTRTLPAADLPPGYAVGFAPLVGVVVAALGALLALYLAFS